MTRASNEAGQRSEALALEAALRLCDEIDWLYSARAATQDEDAFGGDVAAETDVGLVFIQVKCRRPKNGKKKRFHRRRYSRRGIGLAYLRPTAQAKTARHKVLEALCFARSFTRRHGTCWTTE